jgi:hypothetical protein
VSAAGLRALVSEVRSVDAALVGSGDSGAVGPIGVSGMLADQLAKELAAGSAAGAIVVGGVELVARAELLVRIIAGDPSAEDENLVRKADAQGVPVVVVQLWPQAEWAIPFILTPFVVECRAGEGFPVREIADRIVEAAEDGALLASRAPVLADAVRARSVKNAVIRSALIGLVGSRLGVSRKLLTLEQVRLVAQLRATSSSGALDADLPIRAGGAAAALAAGFVLRGAARALRTVLPAPVAHAAVAAAGTWAVAKAFELADARLSGD